MDCIGARLDCFVISIKRDVTLLCKKINLFIYIEKSELSSQNDYARKEYFNFFGAI